MYTPTSAYSTISADIAGLTSDILEHYLNELRVHVIKELAELTTDMKDTDE